MKRKRPKVEFHLGTSDVGGGGCVVLSAVFGLSACVCARAHCESSCFCFRALSSRPLIMRAFLSSPTTRPTRLGHGATEAQQTARHERRAKVISLLLQTMSTFDSVLSLSLFRALALGDVVVATQIKVIYAFRGREASFVSLEEREWRQRRRIIVARTRTR